MSDVDERIQKLKKEASRVGFEAWKNAETTRFMISLIPSGDHQDALTTLLKSAYESGFHGGSAAFAMDMLEQMMDRKR